ncbi:hypothetical protein DH2020_047407 [Rehmannia glutinosa]|uniref:Uncharacterized protein n=1 Tax=Rehmannia glutinosa TaxID=99300 RepID=A0ABR0U8L3_REHGL
MLQRFRKIGRMGHGCALRPKTTESGGVPVAPFIFSAKQPTHSQGGDGSYSSGDDLSEYGADYSVVRNEAVGKSVNRGAVTGSGIVIHNASVSRNKDSVAVAVLEGDTSFHVEAKGKELAKLDNKRRRLEEIDGSLPNVVGPIPAGPFDNSILDQNQKNEYEQYRIRRVRKFRFENAWLREKSVEPLLRVVGIKGWKEILQEG